MIVAIDPGSTTGVAALEPPATLLMAEEEPDRAKVVAWVRHHQPEVLVVEDFKPHAGLPEWASLPAPKMIGVLEELGLKVILQSPSVKRQFPDTLLRAAGMHRPGKPHANDAIRHALYYCWLTQNHIEGEEVKRIYADHIALVTQMSKRVEPLGPR